MRAAKMNQLAGKHFNSGLRAIFFSIGYLGWFVGPVAFILSSALLAVVLMRRQFFSNAREAVLTEMSEQNDQSAGPGSGESIRPDSQ
jgi:uncharacterized membrane protein